MSAHWPKPKGSLKVPLLEALGKRLAKPLYVPEDLPPYPRATVDGYALRAEDTFGASPALPAYLEVVGEVPMGAVFEGALSPGEAVAIPTGGVLPPPADAVIMLENCEEVDAKTIAALRPVAPGENVIAPGEDLRKGELLFGAGKKLGAPDLGLLAALGITEVEVLPPLQVGVLATGNELVPPEATPRPGEIRDTNSYVLLGLLAALGAEANFGGIVRDELAALKQKLAEMLAANDLVLVSGGSSVGARDLVTAAISALGEAKILFHGIALRPGKPALAATAQGKLIIGLPGHPRSAATVFEVLLAPLFRFGFYPPPPLKPVIWARLKRNLASAAGREEFIPVRLTLEKNEVWAEPLLGKSGLLKPLAQAHGLVHIPLALEGIGAGEKVAVKLLSTFSWEEF